MTRKLVWTLFAAFAQLAALPGCLQLPCFTSPPSEAAKKIYDHSDGQPTDYKLASHEQVGQSTAQAREDKATTAKMPDRSLKDVLPTAIEPLPKPKEPKKLGDGSGGIIIIESPGPNGDTVPVQADQREYPLIAALKLMLNKQHDEALRQLKAYDQETQEFILRVAPVLIMVVQRPIKELTPQEIAIVNEQLLNALLQFRSRSELTITKMCFCSEVRGFASYDPLPDNHAFVAGTQARLGAEVQLYVELTNFNCDKTKSGDYVTKLAGTLELQDASGKQVWTRKLERTETPRRTRLNDFHRVYQFFVPPIPPGTYQLTMQIADETNPEQRRVARESVVFRVTPGAN